RHIVGCRVEDYDVFSYLPSESVEVISTNGEHFPAAHLAELLTPDAGASVLLAYSGRYYSGTAAALRNSFGRGASYYLGTYLDVGGLLSFLRPALHEAGVHTVDDLDA